MPEIVFLDKYKVWLICVLIYVFTKLEFLELELILRT